MKRTLRMAGKLTLGRAIAPGLGLLMGAVSARAQTDTPVFTAPADPVVAGTRGGLILFCINSSDHPVTRWFEASLPASIVSGAETNATVLLTNPGANGGPVTINPGGFVKEEYQWSVPAALHGMVMLQVSNYNAVALRVEPESPTMSSAAPGAPAGLPPQPQSSYMGFLTNHLSTYEPIYFILGTYPSAEFQFSIKYKLFRTDDDWNPLGHLYFAYTQTSFWDLLSSDPSFYDTSYKPSAFLYYQNILPKSPVRLDLQPGFEHESNGQGGSGERSLYSAYLQPTATLDLPDHFQLVVQPRAWLYAGVGENNPDIAQYRGYAWLNTALNWSDPRPFSWSDADAIERVQLALKYDTGDEWNHDAWKIDFRFNLAFLPLLSRFNPTIQVQYFTGYGQTLRQYNQYSHGLRAGICLWY